MTLPFEDSPTAADQIDFQNDSAFPALPMASKKVQSKFVPKATGKITERFEIPAQIQVSQTCKSRFWCLIM